MIGADETAAFDKSWNVAFLTTRKESLDSYFADCRTLGFHVQGSQVMASKREIEAAFFSPAGRALRQPKCDHDWRPIPREGPRMACSLCGKEEY